MNSDETASSPGAAAARDRTPAFARVSSGHVDGAACRRLMIVLRTRGCEYARQTGGCSVCGFLNHAEDEIADEAILAQLEAVLGQVDLSGVAELDLLTLGSFLNDREVDATLRASLLRRIGRLSSLRRVSFESRAEYITVEKLRECKALLGDRRVELGIGLESANDRVRNMLVKKGLSRRAFLAVLDRVAEAGLDLLVYLLIKPPGLSEEEAVADAVESARYVFRSAAERGLRARVAFEPVFVCQNTALEALFSEARYRLVNLWSVVRVIEQVHGLGEVFVGLSDEELSRRRMPSSCPDCTDRVVAAIEAYNASQDLGSFVGLDCRCRTADAGPPTPGPRWGGER